jgi:hypothetical protein
MNLKKQFLVLFMLILSTNIFTQNSVDCYENWLMEYTVATAVYEVERGICKGKVPYIRNLCLNEAGIRYSIAVDQAADNYINCIEE